MHIYNRNRGFKHHAFEAIQLGANGAESLIDTFRVTQKRDAMEAYIQAEIKCTLARHLPHKPTAFVREINAGNSPFMYVG